MIHAQASTCNPRYVSLPSLQDTRTFVYLLTSLEMGLKSLDVSISSRWGHSPQGRGSDAPPYAPMPPAVTRSLRRVAAGTGPRGTA